MDFHQKVLFVDPATGYYRVGRYPLGNFFGPVDLGLHLVGKHNSLNIGAGLLAGSVFPGSNIAILLPFPNIKEITGDRMAAFDSDGNICLPNKESGSAISKDSLEFGIRSRQSAIGSSYQNHLR